MLLRTKLIIVLLFFCHPVLAQLAPPKPSPAPATTASTFREIQWDELVPKGWDPFAKFKLGKLGMLSDSDPRVQDMMQELREVLDNAPTVAALDGAAVKLPGFVVPLDEGKDGLKEFLLVPYFGACIHTPPPPANQIVHIVMAKPVKGVRTMDTVWVSGKLKAHRGDSVMGTSGYRLDAVLVNRYEGRGGR